MNARIVCAAIMVIGIIASACESGDIEAPATSRGTPDDGPTPGPAQCLIDDLHYKQVTGEAVLQDINTFWAMEFPKLFSGQYLPPSDFFSYCSPDEPPTMCGGLPNNALYCPGDQTISWDDNLLWDTYTGIGDMAPVAILAHEWGHHIQTLSGTESQYSIQSELQADCYAGMYTKYADEVSRITDPGDVEEAEGFYFSKWTEVPEDYPWFAPNSHGQPVSRLLAFSIGFVVGDGQKCVDYSTYGASDILNLDGYLLALHPGTTSEALNNGGFRLDPGAAGVSARADLRARADLPASSAEVQLEGIAGEWFANSQVQSIGKLDTSPLDDQGITLDDIVGQLGLGATSAAELYEQVSTEGGYHGVFLTIVKPEGGGIVLDAYAPGPAPALDDPAWGPVIDYMLFLILGLRSE